MLPHDGGFLESPGARAGSAGAASSPLREDDPHVGARVPRTAAVIAEHRGDPEPRGVEPPGHLRHRQRAKGEGKTMDAPLAPAALDVFLVEDRQAVLAILAD